MILERVGNYTFFRFSIQLQLICFCSNQTFFIIKNNLDILIPLFQQPATKATIPFLLTKISFTKFEEIKNHFKKLLRRNMICVQRFIFTFEKITFHVYE